MKIGHAKVIADAAKLSEEDWQELRHKSIGSSDAGSVMSMGRYGSPYKTWELKTGKRTIEQNFKMHLGHAMEPVILELAAGELGMDIAKPDLVLAHPDHPELTCNLDGYATNVYGESAIVEAKHAGNYLKGELKRWEESGEPDEDSATEGWWVQVQFQMLITGIEDGYLAALCDKDFFLIPIKAKASFHEMMLGMLPGWFNTHVVNDIEPALGGRDGDVVADAFPTANDDEVVDMGKVKGDIDLARKIKGDIKSLKKELAEMDVRIKAALGSGAIGMCDGEKVISSYSVERKAVDYKALLAEHPDVYEKVVTLKSSRQYRY